MRSTFSSRIFVNWTVLQLLAFVNKGVKMLINWSELLKISCASLFWFQLVYSWAGFGFGVKFLPYPPRDWDITIAGYTCFTNRADKDRALSIGAWTGFLLPGFRMQSWRLSKCDGSDGVTSSEPERAVKFWLNLNELVKFYLLVTFPFVRSF